MIFRRNYLPFEVKKEKKIYTLKQKIRGKGAFGVDLKKITSTNDEDYKLIRLNTYGISKGEKDRIQRVVQNIHSFKGKNSIPKLIYSDDSTIVLEWIEGDILSGSTLDENNAIALARFNAENCIEIKNIPSENIIGKIIKQLNDLTAQNFLSDDTQQTLLDILNSNKFQGIRYFHESLCFADTATKNYIINEERLVYFDVYGLDRRSLSRVYTKQLTQMPKEYRKEYSRVYKETLPVEISHLIPIAYINYLVTRIYSNLNKSHFLIRKRRRNKADLALQNLRSFLYAINNGIDPEEWLIQHT
jgi:hypothetical protein